MTRMATYPPFDIFARWLLNTRWFSAIMISVIILNSLVLMVDGELPDDAEHASYRFTTDVLDFLFLTMFVAEIALKFLDKSTDFFTEGWNIFDLAITSFVSIVLLLLYQCFLRLTLNYLCVVCTWSNL